MAKHYVDSKQIVVKNPGTLHLLGGITGPINTPFPCKVNVILNLVITRNDIYEVLADGTEIKLDMSNYNTENTKVSKKPVVVDKEEVKEIIEKEVSEVKQEPKIETGNVEISKPQKNNQGNQNNKRNFNNQKNN